MKNYTEIATYGRGAGTDKAFYVSFEVSLKENDNDTIKVLSDKSGIAIKKIATGGKPVSGFINISELNLVYTRLQLAENKLALYAADPSKKPAAEWIFRMGNFKGKTPAQALLSGASVEDLLGQKDFLLKNASGKFAEANKAGAKAIDEAIASFKAGTLKAGSSSGPIPIYKSGPRYMPKKDRQPYQTSGWEINILCLPGDKNPYAIEWISKDVTIKDNMIQSAANVKSESVSLTEEEFVTAITTAKEIFANYTMCNCNARFKWYKDHKDDWKKESARPATPTVEAEDENPFV